MRPHLLLLLLVLISGTVTAQQSNVLISFSAGPSFPAGDFASSNTNVEDAGYADLGLSVSLLEVSYFFSEQAGINLSVTGTRHLLNNNAFETEYWAAGGIFLGPVISVPLSETPLFLDLKAGGGPFYHRYIPGGTQDNVDGTSIGFKGASTMRYHLSDRIALNATLEFLAAAVNMESSLNRHQSYRSLNLSAGISFGF